MGMFKQAMIDVEDLALEAAREQASESFYLYQDFIHEQRDMARESIEIAILDALAGSGCYDEYEMDDFWSYMGFRG